MNCRSVAARGVILSSTSLARTLCLESLAILRVRSMKSGPGRPRIMFIEAGCNDLATNVQKSLASSSPSFAGMFNGRIIWQLLCAPAGQLGSQ